MLNFIKNHWFGLLMGLIAFFYVGLMIIIALSPRQDHLDRGFIPCTKKMLGEIYACEQNSIVCMSKAIVRNNICDISVIGSGFSAWWHGKQASPWENYFFEPEPQKLQTEPDEVLEEYYRQNDDIATQMELLHNKRIALEQALTEKKTDETQLPQ